ncbi:MAG TPA: circadian clock KaiB family protein [Candidatus Thermoplasmatota archaeon]|nr:circadian clock KaiB family protein [Candidatus Thermoplasmatota archaeon]
MTRKRAAPAPKEGAKKGRRTSTKMPARRPASSRTKARAARRDRFVLKLYVTGATPASLRAVETIKQICDVHLEGRYDLQVIDIYQQPALARGEQIVAVPTLIRKLPAPIRRLVGDLSARERVLLGLDLKRAAAIEAAARAAKKG